MITASSASRDTTTRYDTPSTTYTAKPVRPRGNVMKKDMVVEEFAYRVAKIADHTKDWPLADFRDKPVRDAGRTKKFYKVEAGGGKSVVFPSDRIIFGGKKRCVKGSPATPRDFWEQKVTTEDCLAAYKNRIAYGS